MSDVRIIIGEFWAAPTVQDELVHEVAWHDSPCFGISNPASRQLLLAREAIPHVGLRGKADLPIELLPQKPF